MHHSQQMHLIVYAFLIHWLIFVYIGTGILVWMSAVPLAQCRSMKHYCLSMHLNDSVLGLEASYRTLLFAIIAAILIPIDGLITLWAIIN